MKSRHKELLDRSIAATISAIEIYNKPDFLYREEAFSVLAINGWELLLKAKWLADNGNKIRSLYVYERKLLKSGKRGKKEYIKLTRSGNPFTHSIDYFAKKMVEKGSLDNMAWNNIQALLEIRDSAIHFYNHTGNFALRLQEIGTASLKNFVTACKDWFGRDLSEFNFYLMPLSFISLPHTTTGLVLNAEEKNFIQYVNELEDTDHDEDSPYSVSVNIEVKFTRSKVKDALDIKVTNDPNATSITLTDEQIRKNFPWDYGRLTSECKKRYSDFKVIKKYHDLRKLLLKDKKFGSMRFLDPGNSKSQKKPFFNPNILNELDKHYSKQ